MNADVERGTVNKLLTLFTQEGAATCKATLLLTPTAFSPGWSEGSGTLRPLVGSKRAVGKGVLTIAFVRKHDDSDIDPETSDRHHHSKIDNTEWGQRNTWVGRSMRLRYGVGKSSEVLIDQ